MTLTKIIVYFIITFTQQGYLEGPGDFALYFSSENAAVAGANLFSIGELSVNPSTPVLHRGFRAILNGRFSTFHESRSEPVYDQFDNTVGYAVLYSRFNNYTTPGPIALAFSRKWFGIGFSYDSPVDYNYSYSFTDRLDAYTVVKRETIERDGSLSRYSFSVAGNFRFFDFGVVFSRINGNIDYIHTLWMPDSGTQSDSFSTSLSGNSFSIAGGISLGYRLRAVISYSSGFSDNNKGIPRSVDFGAELRPVMRLPARIFLRIGYDDWSLVDTTLQGQWRVHFGTNQMIFPGTSISLGAAVWRTPYKGLWTATYAGGVHHRVLPGLYLNVSFTFTPRTTSRYIDNKYLKVKENLTEVVVGLRLSR